MWKPLAILLMLLFLLSSARAEPVSECEDKACVDGTCTSTIYVGSCPWTRIDGELRNVTDVLNVSYRGLVINYTFPEGHFALCPAVKYLGTTYTFAQIKSFYPAVTDYFIKERHSSGWKWGLNISKIPAGIQAGIQEFRFERCGLGGITLADVELNAENWRAVFFGKYVYDYSDLAAFAPTVNKSGIFLTNVSGMAELFMDPQVTLLESGFVGNWLQEDTYIDENFPNRNNNIDDPITLEVDNVPTAMIALFINTTIVHADLVTNAVINLTNTAGPTGTNINAYRCNTSIFSELSLIWNNYTNYLTDCESTAFYNMPASNNRLSLNVTEEFNALSWFTLLINSTQAGATFFRSKESSSPPFLSITYYENNTAPSATFGAYVPVGFTTNISVTANFTVIDDDLSLNTSNATFIWTVNGVRLYNETALNLVNGSTATSTLHHGNFTKYQLVNVSIVLNDSNATRTIPATSIANVSNAPPTVLTSTVIPAGATDDDIVTCNYTVTDMDGDSPTINAQAFVWYRNGVLMEFTTEALAASSTAFNDLIVCNITLNDSISSGHLTSAAVQILAGVGGGGGGGPTSPGGGDRPILVVGEENIQFSLFPSSESFIARRGSKRIHELRIVNDGDIDLFLDIKRKSTSDPVAASWIRFLTGEYDLLDLKVPSAKTTAANIAYIQYTISIPEAAIIGKTAVAYDVCHQTVCKNFTIALDVRESLAVELSMLWERVIYESGAPCIADPLRPQMACVERPVVLRGKHMAIPAIMLLFVLFYLMARAVR